MKNIILVGHSHTNCIYLEMKESFSSEFLVRRIHMVNILNEIKSMEVPEEVSLSDLVIQKIEEIIETLPKKKKWYSNNKEIKHNINIIMLFGGNFHNIFGLIKAKPAFDFVHPKFSSLEFDKTAEIIPYNALRELFRSDLSVHEEIIKEIGKRFSELNIMHLSSPPPVFDGEKVMENLGSYFTIRHENPELVHKSLRFKLWKVYTEMAEQICDKYKVPFIHVPSEMLDEDEMFLKLEYFEDSTHANQKYANKLINNLYHLLK